MTTIQIFVQHGGEWIDNPSGTKTYHSSKEAEIMFLPRDCTYRNLVDVVHNFFNLNPALHRITMTYGCKTSIGIVVLHIRNDTDVQHFLQFNMHTDTTTPLCLVINGGPYDFPLPADQDHRPFVGVILDVPTQDEPVEDIRGVEDIEQDEFGGGCSSNENGTREVQFIDQEDVALHNDHTNRVEEDCNVPSDGNMGGVSVKDLGGSVRTSANIRYGTSSVVIEKNQLFKNKKELRKHVNLHAMKRSFEFRVVRSTTTLFVARCLTEGCKWRLRATKLRNSDYFKVSKIIPTHSCTRGIILNDHRQASSWLIGQCIKSRYEGAGHVYKPKDIIHDVQKEFGVNISYDKAWRARELALDSIRGTVEESYTILPSYCAMLEAKNPGSVTAIQTNEANHFKYFFMSIGACIRGFRSSIRPVIAVDSAYLKAKYLGTLFVAACMDGNNQIYPIAFGICDSKNDVSWEWFMTKLKDVICEVEGLVFVSDLNSSIEKAIKKAFPHAIHGICINYLSQNLKAKFKDSTLIPLFHKAAKVHLTSEFNEMMKEISRCDANAAKYLIEAGVGRWARSHFDGRRYNIMTSSIVECLNEILKDAKELSVTMLIDHLRGLLQEWFYERRTAAANMKGFLSDWAESEVHKRAEISTQSQYCIRQINCFEMEVLDGDRNFVVNLHNKTCSCREFDLDQLPCVHALAVAHFHQISVTGLCSSFYTTTSLVASYAESIRPVGHKDDWEIPDEVRSRVVLPPLMLTSAGRKRNQEILRSTGEDQHMKKCGRCRGIGHNRQTCKEPFPFHPQKG